MYVFFLDPDDQSGAEIETVYILFFICLIDAFSQRVTFCNCTSQGFKTASFMTWNCTRIVITGTWLSPSEISCLDFGIVMIEDWNEIKGVNWCHTIGWCCGNDHNGCNKVEIVCEMHFKWGCVFLRRIDDNCWVSLFYLCFCFSISPCLFFRSSASFIFNVAEERHFMISLFVCIRYYSLSETVSIEF